MDSYWKITYKKENFLKQILEKGIFEFATEYPLEIQVSKMFNLLLIAVLCSNVDKCIRNSRYECYSFFDGINQIWYKPNNGIISV